MTTYTCNHTKANIQIRHIRARGIKRQNDNDYRDIIRGQYEPQSIDFARRSCYGFKIVKWFHLPRSEVSASYLPGEGDGAGCRLGIVGSLFTFLLQFASLMAASSSAEHLLHRRL